MRTYLHKILRKRNVSENFVEKIKTHFMFKFFFFSNIVPFMRWYEKVWSSRTGALDAG